MRKPGWFLSRRATVKPSFTLAAQQTLGIRQVETKTNHTSDGSKCNVTLLEGGHDTEFTIAFFHDTVTSNERSGIRSGMRTRQSKARNERTIGKTR